MTCLVFRAKARLEEPFPDGINLYIESKGQSTDNLQPTAYRFSILPNGTYSVANGDTLSAIASRLRTTVRHLVEVNHITDPDRISIGQRLTY